MDDACDVANRCGRLHERMDGLALGHVDDRGADLKSGIAQDFCRRIGGLFAKVSQQDVLACADPAGDRLTDRSGPDDDDDLDHGAFLS